MIAVYKEVLGTSEAAFILNISVQKIYGLIQSGDIIAYKDHNGRAWKIPSSSIDKYITKRKES